MSGTAVKVAFKAVTAFAPGYYQETVTGMVPDMVNQLAPFWADFQVSGGADFGDYLSKRGDEVSEALLAVTDDMAGPVRPGHGRQGVQARCAAAPASTWRQRCRTSAR